ncbi:MAG TPA: FxSxx-COOH system tetratricopeptide repeat protein [Streptosporangiaceae bacterium]|nr:FxSxx-COOH system tetratricopeptide repeat protein [Streptosporangiaceae bacterium]
MRGSTSAGRDSNIEANHGGQAIGSMTNIHNWPAGPGQMPTYLSNGTAQVSAADGLIVSLPPRNQSFTGRAALLDEIADRLKDPGAVTLQGISGVGKTQQALEYAHRQLDLRNHSVIWWVNAEDQAVVTNDLARLATLLGVSANPDTDDKSWRTSLSSILTVRADWLLICDNFDVSMLATLELPLTGRLLITGRGPELNRYGNLVPVGIFHRPESKNLLHRRCPSLDDADANVVAHELGDLPLAIEQAGCFLHENPMGVDDYLKVLDKQPAKAGLSETTLNRHPGLPAVVSASRSGLYEQAPEAGEILDQLAFLAPQPLPLYDRRHRPFGVRIGEPLVASTIIRRITKLGLAHSVNRALEVHRLTQLLIRSLIPAQDHQMVLFAAQGLIATADPGDPADHHNWPNFESLIPHLNAVEGHLIQAEGSPQTKQEDPKYRRLVIDAGRHLCARGQYRSARNLAGRAGERWSAALGPDQADTLDARMVVARAARGEGDNVEAREIGLDVLDRRRQTLGDTHADTLATANELAFTWYRLGEYQQANDLARDTLQQAAALGDDHYVVMDAKLSLAAALTGLGDHDAAHDLDRLELDRRRLALNDDHPDSLRAANNLAFDRSNLGDHQGALSLYAETLRRCRAVLGLDHPDTLITAFGYGCELSWLGQDHAAHDLDNDTYERRRRVLGPDHSDTLWSASKLAFDRSRLGNNQAARDLEADTLERRKRILGPDHPHTLRSAHYLAYNLSYLDDYRAARDLDKDTYDRRSRVLGPDHPDTLRSANNLAYNLSCLGDHEAARDLHKDTYDRRCRTLGPDHPDTKRSAGNFDFETSSQDGRRSPDS